MARTAVCCHICYLQRVSVAWIVVLWISLNMDLKFCVDAVTSVSSWMSWKESCYK